MAGIELIQGTTTYNAAGASHPAPITIDVAVLCYLSFVGGATDSYEWSLTKPSGSLSVISSIDSAGPTFLPDIDGGSYSVQLVDSDSNVYVLDIVTPTATASSGLTGVVTYATTFASARALGQQPATSTINIRCYATLGDGGGGIFTWDASSSAADDGGTVLAITGVTTGRLLRQYSGEVDARWFGASTASSDNKSAITLALAVGYGRVFLPRGTWTILTQIELSAGKFIRGEGEDVTVIHHTGSDGPAVFTGSAEYGSKPHGLMDLTITSDSMDCVADEVDSTHSNYDAQYVHVTANVLAAGKAGFRATGSLGAGGAGFVYFPRYDKCRVYGNMANELQAGFRFEAVGGAGTSGGVIFGNVVKPQVWLVGRHFDFNHSTLCQVDTPVNVGAIVTKTFAANAGTDVITCAGHGLTNGRAVPLTTTGTLPAGLPLDSVRPVFVRDATADTFKAALTAGGAAIDITDAGTGTHKIGLGRYYFLGALCNQATFLHCKPEIPQAIDLMAEVADTSDQGLIDLAAPTVFSQLGDSHTGVTSLTTRNFTQVVGTDSNYRSEAVTYALLLQDLISEKTTGAGVDINGSGAIFKTTGPEISTTVNLTGSARLQIATGFVNRPDGTGVAWAFKNGSNQGIGDLQLLTGNGAATTDILDHVADRVSVSTNNLTNVITADCSSLTTNGAAVLEFHAVCTKDSGAGTGSAGDIAAFSRRVVVKNAGGTLTIKQADTIGTDVNDIGVSIAAGASAFSVSGTDVRMQITGAVNNVVKMGGSVRGTRTAGA